jgi:hypothetical protein
MSALPEYIIDVTKPVNSERVFWRGVQEKRKLKTPGRCIGQAFDATAELRVA